MRRWRLGEAGIAIALLVLIVSAVSNDALPTSVSAQPAIPATAYKGSGSCSAVACHGSIAPVPGSSVLRNEHTTWISDDKHARAYEVLLDKRSQQIALNLKRDKEELVPAERDLRCLACHTTPRLGADQKHVAWMNQDGVGCESCHGAAEKWLGLHTTDWWKSQEDFPAVKESYGFTNTKNVGRRVELCAGCHVGQAAGDELPLRDVNHDLIAAGHPRLNFEFTAYQANQPSHWNKKKPSAAEAAADFPARAWALGQLGSAKAALKLLVSRSVHAAGTAAGPLPAPLPNPDQAHAPWPEFTEYGCFSCHHSLADERWRKERAQRGLALGAPTWGSWSFPLAIAFLENSAVAGDPQVALFQSTFDDLAAEMSRPLPDTSVTKAKAAKAIKALDAVIRDLSARLPATSPFDAAGVEQLIARLNSPDAWTTKVASWDHAAQRYLALVPLNQTRQQLDPKRTALSAELQQILDKLTFQGGFDSPRGFDPGRIPGSAK